MRVELLQYGLRIWGDNPILGVGFGNGPEHMIRYWGSSVSVHNLFLGVAVETGILGLCVFLYIYYIVLKDLSKIWWQANPAANEPVTGFQKKDAFHATVLIIAYNVIPGLSHGLTPTRPWFVVFAFAVIVIRLGMSQQPISENAVSNRIPSNSSRAA